FPEPVLEFFPEDSVFCVFLFLDATKKPLFLTICPRSLIEGARRGLERRQKNPTGSFHFERLAKGEPCPISVYRKPVRISTFWPF
ncbi:MAG: hypothetical protein J6N19_17910, partial [Clostridium sp.]|nr:hypothetical protein [Clostridium sp.]